MHRGDSSSRKRLSVSMGLPRLFACCTAFAFSRGKPGSYVPSADTRGKTSPGSPPVQIFESKLCHSWLLMLQKIASQGWRIVSSGLARKSVYHPTKGGCFTTLSRSLNTIKTEENRPPKPLFDDPFPSLRTCTLVQAYRRSVSFRWQPLLFFSTRISAPHTSG